MLNIDLHCHSNISDGILSPAELVMRAHANGVQVLALTDHDEVSGIAAARAKAEALGMKFVPGVEISITWAGATLHIVGLQIDVTNKSLTQGLAEIRNGRLVRGRKIASRLAAAGIPDAYDGAMKFAPTPHFLARKHFARFMVKAGHCKDVEEAFESYLKSGQGAHVAHRWANVTDAINWIHRAGGIAVVAHPGRYRLTDEEFARFLGEFKQLGGAGIEVVSGRHTPEQYEKYAAIARRYGLLASAGSDFHAPDESRIDVGTLPPLPGGVKPVWHDWF